MTKPSSRAACLRVWLENELAAQLDWPIADEYIDNDISASEYSAKTRPAYERMLEDIRSGAVDAVLVYNLDRLTQLRSQAASLSPAAARQAAELVQDTRRRLDLNVSEELALEALAYRLEATSSNG